MSDIFLYLILQNVKICFKVLSYVFNYFCFSIRRLDCKNTQNGILYSRSQTETVCKLN